MNGNIRVNHARCIGCGMCARDCPLKAFQLTNGKSSMMLDSCLECGHCVAVCPQGAISMSEYDMTEVIPYECGSSDISPEAFLKHMKLRRTVRQFENTAVSRAVIERIIEAGRFSPTGLNRQNVRFAVMENPEEKIEPEAIRQVSWLFRAAVAAGRLVKLPLSPEQSELSCGFFFHGAPAVIFVISEDPVNAALAAAHMETMAEAEGLGVLYAGLFAKAVRFSGKLRKRLRIAGKERLVAALAIGYPAVHYLRSAPRKKARTEWL